MKIRGLNGLWEVRRRKGQDKVLSVKHLSIPPNRNSSDFTDLLILHILQYFLCRNFQQIRCRDDPSRKVQDLCGTTVMSKWAILCRFIKAADCFADVTSRNKSPERILRIVLTCPILLVIAFSIRKGDTDEKEAKRFSLYLSPFWQKHGLLLVPSQPPPVHEIPHFSNLPSGTAGEFFKARRQGNPHNVLPGTVQGRSQGGFLDMNESPPTSHPLPKPSNSRTFSAERTSKPSPVTHVTPPPHTLPRKGPFHCPNNIPRGKGYRVVLRPLRAKG
ncbi:uncharacterized protein TNCT_358591 [Trichonephila clavata]|uniref:Uncharacterized protein n=1 Tax=Trichonephila clavata TaxID=2740835 RepID=A0A8X6FK64_TRICU|nr:uncharacterized protein TNCT_358591 [Trichonephila clavata]